MDGSFFASLGAWNWFLAAALLLVLELVLPGTFMLWLGLAALVTGAIALAYSLGWQIEIALFAGFSLVFVIVGRSLMHRAGKNTSDQPFLNRRADALVGRVFTLAEPIVSGAGRVRVDDTVWRVSGSDAPVGTRVKVVRIDGSVLVVEAE
jgi:membrane protein implicated in regulation of membrane protease activity